MYDPEEKLDRFLKTVARRNGKKIGASAIFSHEEKILLLNYGDSFELPAFEIDEEEKIKLAVEKLSREKFGENFSLKKYIGSFCIQEGDCRCYAFEVGVSPSNISSQFVWVDPKTLDRKKVNKKTAKLLMRFVKIKEKEKTL